MATRETTVRIPIDQIKPNPYQPETRLEVPEETATQYGLSILETGLIHSPIVRKVTKAASGDTLGLEVHYEMGDGWLRLAGHKWLAANGHPEYNNIPVIVRKLTDEQMAMYVMDGNSIHQDLNPIEKAILYQRYLAEFGITQAELAKKHNCSQGEIGNTIRLLELPDDIQHKIISQEISETQGRQLLRLNKIPLLQQNMLEHTKKNNLTVSQMDVLIHQSLWENSLALDGRFPQDGCMGCEKRSMLLTPYGNGKKEARCLDRICWENKRDEYDKQQAEAVKQVKEGSDPSSKKIFVGEELTQFVRMGTPNYTDVLDNPAECDICAKRGLYEYNPSTPKPYDVCMDPQCYRNKKSKRTRDENKSKKQRDNELTASIGRIINKNVTKVSALTLATRLIASKLTAAARDDVMGLFPDLPKHSNGKINLKVLKQVVTGMYADELMRLLAAMVICQGRRDNEYSDYSTELNHEQQMEIAILEGTYNAKATENALWQQANCKGCSHANQLLVNTGEICCETTWYRKVKDDVCENSPNKAKLEGTTVPASDNKPELPLDTALNATTGGK